jgi:hypothetical protein
MRGSGFVQLAFTAAVFIVFNLPPAVGNTAAQDPGARGTQAGGGFKEMLARVDAAQVELQNGRVATVYVTPPSLRMQRAQQTRRASPAAVGMPDVRLHCYEAWPYTPKRRSNSFRTSR